MTISAIPMAVLLSRHFNLGCGEGETIKAPGQSIAGWIACRIAPVTMGDLR
jgi:hypothetical protein